MIWLATVLSILSPFLVESEIDDKSSLRAGRLKELEQIAERIEKAVVTKDWPTILEISSRVELTVGFEREQSREQIEEDFRNQRGLLYGDLFDTEVLRKYSKSNLRDKSVSLKEIFESEPAVSRRIKFAANYEGGILVGERLDRALIIFEWEGTPEDYGRHSFPHFLLLYDGQWRIVEYCEIC